MSPKYLIPFIWMDFVALCHAVQIHGLGSLDSFHVTKSCLQGMTSHPFGTILCHKGMTSNPSEGISRQQGVCPSWHLDAIYVIKSLQATVKSV